MRISDWSSDVCSSDLDDQLHPVGFGDDIVGVDAVGQAKAIGKARTAAAIDREAQRGRRAGLAFRDPADARRRSGGQDDLGKLRGHRSEEHTSELQSLMRSSYAVFCLKKKKKHICAQSVNKT